MERYAVKYLLDTAPWINGVTLPQVLPPRIRRLLDNDEMKGYAVSACWRRRFCIDWAG
jgi:hypothetical protein